MRFLTRSIWVLSIVSLLTDMSSEMLYPIMPIYLKSIGFSVALIGILEGFAEAIAGLSKGYFGRFSDLYGKRLPFVTSGYFLSAISKPVIAAFSNVIGVFTGRTIDRIGKGIRTGARDAILSEETTIENKGKVFGFHRSIDTVGAVLGPGIALLYIAKYPNNYKDLFYLAFIPGILGVLLTLLIKEKEKPPIKEKIFPKLFSFLSYLKYAKPSYRKLIIGLLAFAFFNSSDLFLILIMKEKGLTDTEVISVYIFYNLIYAITSLPMGYVGDYLGLKKTYILGLCLFCLVYTGMAIGTNLFIFYGIMALYGIYAASTEGISKALISNIAEKKDAATAIGTYAGLNSIMALLSSSVAGAIWQLFGAKATFITAVVGTFFIIIYFVSIKIEYSGQK